LRVLKVSPKPFEIKFVSLTLIKIFFPLNNTEIFMF